MPSLAFVALGSNLGDRRGTLEGAVAALAGTYGVAVRKVSSFHETEPVGGPAGQGLFLNAAAVLETTLDPFGLLRVLREIEERFGRTRTVHWGERTLDLDLLLFDDRIIDTPELTIPHPRLTERRFVLEPLAEVAPDAVDPITKRTIVDLLANVVARKSR
jgi:2-amino-4-hydroxy-6-hydroxymethyldihydropteridine diphosphokinase